MRKTDNGGGAPTFDRLGTLCVEGQEIATYLFLVPDDQTQWERVRGILDAVIRESTRYPRRDMDEIGRHMRRALAGAPSMTVIEQLMTGFDRLIALSLQGHRRSSRRHLPSEEEA